MTATSHARSAAGSARSSPMLRGLARAGFVASGAIHLALGLLALRVAFHQSARSDQSGAIQQVGKLPGGPVLLWAMTIGLFGLALWLVLAAVLAVGGQDAKRWGRVLQNAGKAAAYAALGFTALAFARGSSSNSRTATERASSDLLRVPGGQVLLVLVGLIAVGVGGYMIVKGVRRGFRKDLAMPSGAAGTVVTVLAIAGYAAKGVAVVAVGVLFVVAAVTLDPDRASGLDGGLRALASIPFGRVLLVVIAFGLVAFGVYTFVRARYARL
ncbi:DUF1206 domain-containing protein [Amnibacterium kyonggiense]